MSNDIQIYVADLAAYNNGQYHGVWVNATDSADDMQEQIQAMLKASPIEGAEEFAIHDYQGFGGVIISEWSGLEEVHVIACFIDEHDELAIGLLKHFDEIEEAIKAINQGYHGVYQDIADYAQQFTDDTTQIPQHLELYIDYERMGRDWELSGDIFTIITAHDQVHVFSSY